MPALKSPLLTTWPCFTEAMYLSYSKGGWQMQSLLWKYVATQQLQFHTLTAEEVARMQGLMAKYADAPMDLADASLVVAAETLGLRRVFTLDSHFYAYRLADGSAFEVVP